MKVDEGFYFRFFFVFFFLSIGVCFQWEEALCPFVFIYVGFVSVGKGTFSVCFCISRGLFSGGWGITSLCFVLFLSLRHSFHWKGRFPFSFVYT